ncbi:hypothetical protein NPIL_470711 [Nephila pilipes]|uniref:Uncharacterized protein n=1 Tax=Nephila pilipes TaxID=299642 RepID=A0A8X6UMY1_NEPPI|nr:hypothetical protein NPIL_470711 [Nephila pilipes]
MVICEDKNFLEKAEVVDNLKATITRKKIPKEEFQKKCIELTNKLIKKTSPEHYDNVLSLLDNALDSQHFPPQANKEAVPKDLNIKLKRQRYVSTKKTYQKTTTVFSKPTQEQRQSIS